MIAQIKHLAAHHYPAVVAIRRAIHAQPELAYEERETARLVASELADLGLVVTTAVAGTGVVALLKCQNPHARCIALRADMDALPITELTEVSYRSRNIGVMHACGHDLHTASMLGVARILTALKGEIQGTFKFIFQPSEEKLPSGAAAMIAAGVLANPKVDKILGLHVHPELEAGEVGFKAGNFMASADEIYITVIGRGGHASQPLNFISPLIMAAEMLLALHTMNDAALPLVLSFGKINADGATNVIPDRTILAGTLRCFDEAIRASAHLKIKATCEEVATRYSGRCEVEIRIGSPVLKNDKVTTDKATKLAQEYLAGHTHELPIRMGAEDFAYYSQLVPSCFYRLGVGSVAKGITAPIHSPHFDVDERALEISMGLMSWIAINS